VLVLHAAWRDWSAAGSPGAPNSAPPSSLGKKTTILEARLEGPHASSEADQRSRKEGEMR